MIIIVDTNILFSALISPNSLINKLLAYPSLDVRYITCHYALAELFKHQAKIVKHSKKPVNEVFYDFSTLINRLQLYNETLIEKKYWQEANRLTEGVDNYDISYVALALQHNSKLWTGDKKLITHLRSMGFTQVIDTSELYGLFGRMW